MNDDAELLRLYADEGSQDAFSELVRRHVDLVYGAAMRRTGGDTHRAKDVAQRVFTALARNAGRLSRHAVLGGWLHTATRNAAINLMISENRRQTRENEALALEPAKDAGATSPDWDRLRPVLDEAIDELPEGDRAAVVLRFLERRAFAEVGAVLRVSEDAARMRADRGLEKLRAALGRRGITSTAAALGAVVSTQAMVSAPAGLASALAPEALAAAGIAVSTLMTTKIIAIAAASAVVAFGAGAYVGLSRSFDAPPPPPIETPQQSQTIASLRHDNVSLKAEVDRLTSESGRQAEAIGRLKAQREASASPKGAALGLSRGQQQQAMLNYLRQIAAASAQFQLEKNRPAASVQELVGEDKYIRQIIPLDGEDYSALNLQPGQPLTVTSANGVTVTYDPTGPNTTVPDYTPAELRVQELGRKIQPSGNKAVAAYRAANGGNNPPNPESLIPYFATPQEGADYVEFLEAQKAAQSH